MNLCKLNTTRRLKRYLPLLFIGAALMSCSEENISSPILPMECDDTFTLDVSLNIAEITSVNSRAFSDKPDYKNLKLYMVEFEGGASPLDNTYIKQINSITDETLNTDDNDIHFKVTLDKVDQPRILHLIALPDDKFEIPYGLGLEGTVMPGLVVSNDTPAYWQRLEFPDGYGHYIKDGDDFIWETYKEVAEKLDHVPMLCNFAKVSLVSIASDFVLEGFTVLNRPESGTVLPYNSTDDIFPDFLNGNEVLSYSQVNNVYNGYTPTTKVTDTNPDIVYNTDPKYLYERPHSTLNNPVVIMKGVKNGESRYYKIDIGYKDESNNLFHFYNILRNFEYAITVTAVEADGYASAQEALDGVVFNNFSFDVKTKQLLSVSDSNAMLQVNNTTFVVTSPATSTEYPTIELYYKYENLKGDPKDNNNIKFLDEQTGAENNAITGSAIKSLSISNVDESNGWRKVTITTPNPTTTRESQEIVMFDPTTGLGRLINIIVRLPWQFMDAGVWGGTYYYGTEFNTDWKGYVSNSTTVGQPLTVRFRIDDNIPEAKFPLKFVYESSNQNIENNKIDNNVVDPGASLFANVTTNVIKYVKTITWTDYNTKLSESSSGTIEEGSDGYEHHYVTAHFLTTKTIGTETTTIRIQNPYMSPTPTVPAPPTYVDVTFTGKDNSAPVNDYSTKP